MDSADFGLYGYDVGNAPCGGWFPLFTTSGLPKQFPLLSAFLRTITHT